MDESNIPIVGGPYVKAKAICFEVLTLGTYTHVLFERLNGTTTLQINYIPTYLFFFHFTSMHWGFLVTNSRR